MENIRTAVPARPLGRSGRTVSALGVGTWALGGPYTFDGRDAGWGAVDDAVSIRALRLDQVRALLTVDGRTLVQGALGYLWALQPAVIPMPGIRTPEQAAENAYALALGPLPADAAEQITTLLADPPERR